MADTKLNELAQRARLELLEPSDINAVVMTVVAALVERDKKEHNYHLAVTQNTKAVKEIQEEYPLLPTEADDLSRAVRRKGVDVLGGKRSNAYANSDLRQRVYQDIYGEIKRQFGLVEASGRRLSYKKLKRKDLSSAFSIVESYEPPIAIANEIETENECE